MTFRRLSTRNTKVAKKVLITPPAKKKQPPAKKKVAFHVAVAGKKDGGINEADLRKTDVLFGRGNGIVQYDGNIKFRHLVWKHRPVYLSSEKHSKGAIARNVMAEIEKLSPPGRFLEQIARQTYAVVEDKRVFQKVCQSLREKKVGCPAQFVGRDDEQLVPPERTSQSPKSKKAPSRSRKADNNEPKTVTKAENMPKAYKKATVVKSMVETTKTKKSKKTATTGRASTNNKKRSSEVAQQKKSPSSPMVPDSTKSPSPKKKTKIDLGIGSVSPRSARAISRTQRIVMASIRDALTMTAAALVDEDGKEVPKLSIKKKKSESKKNEGEGTSKETKKDRAFNLPKLPLLKREGLSDRSFVKFDSLVSTVTPNSGGDGNVSLSKATKFAGLDALPFLDDDFESTSFELLPEGWEDKHGDPFDGSGSFISVEDLDDELASLPTSLKPFSSEALPSASITLPKVTKIRAKFPNSLLDNDYVGTLPLSMPTSLSRSLFDTTAAPSAAKAPMSPGQHLETVLDAALCLPIEKGPSTSKQLPLMPDNPDNLLRRSSSISGTGAFQVVPNVLEMKKSARVPLGARGSPQCVNTSIFFCSPHRDGSSGEDTIVTTGAVERATSHEYTAWPVVPMTAKVVATASMGSLTSLLMQAQCAP